VEAKIKKVNVQSAAGPCGRHSHRQAALFNEVVGELAEFAKLGFSRSIFCPE